MSDDPTQVLRVYFVVDVSTLAAVPNEAQWQALTQAARGKPLAAAITGYARASQNYISASKRAQGTGLKTRTRGGRKTGEISQRNAAKSPPLLCSLPSRSSGREGRGGLGPIRFR